DSRFGSARARTQCCTPRDGVYVDLRRDRPAGWTVARPSLFRRRRCDASERLAGGRNAGTIARGSVHLGLLQLPFSCACSLSRLPNARLLESTIEFEI